MLISSWLRNWKSSAAAAHRRTPTSPGHRAGFRPRLEALEDRLTPSSTIVQTNLVSDDIQFAPAQVQDPHLVNPWGLTPNPNGAWWVANEGTGTSTLYDTSKAQATTVPLVVNIPHGAPTGIVFNSGTGFKVSENGKQGPSAFLFATVDCTISGWNPSVDVTHAIIEATNPGALYLGLTSAADGHGGTRLYAADFLNNKIDVYDQDFHLVSNLPGNFTDSHLPDTYHPFNIQEIGGKLYVEYAPADQILAGKVGPAEGGIDVYNADGQLQKRLIHHGHLNQPWAVAMAPSNFGSFSNDLLVGNFGDGHINAFDPDNGHFDGELKDANGQAITITHLWGLAFGNGGAAGPTNTLYFTAGLSSHLAPSNDPFHGLFGSLQVAPAAATTPAPTPTLAKATTSVNGPASGLPYPTAATVSQLIADINYANKTGGAFTINLKANTTFDLKSADNATDGGNGMPVIGGKNAVNLTITGNGDIIERVGGFGFNRKGVSIGFRLFDVAPGASLTLDHVTLQGGWMYGSGGGAIYNQGTLTISNGSFLSNNSAGYGGAIYNYGGTVTINSSTLASNRGTSGGGGIYTNGGTVTVGNGSILSGNAADYGGGIFTNGGTLTVSNSTLSSNSARFGGGIYNGGGTVTVSNGSTLSGNSAYHADYPWSGGDGGGIYNSGGSVTISNSTLSGNTADAYFGSGGGIYNNGGTVTIDHFSSITGNTSSDLGDDVYNLGELYRDGTSTIGILDGNLAILI